MMETSKKKKSIFENPLFSTKVKSANVKPPELLFGYFIGPFGALLASGIFTNFLNRYWTDVLFANYRETVTINGDTVTQWTAGAGTAIGTFLTLLPLISTILIVIGNLLVGQLIERTKTRAGKARPWLLLWPPTLPPSKTLWKPTWPPRMEPLSWPRPTRTARPFSGTCLWACICAWKPLFPRW